MTLLATLPGDFDIDVEGFDFLEWQRGESPNPFSAWDLANWEANYGTVAPLSATSTAVPEPATGIMLLIGMMAMLFRRDVVVSTFDSPPHRRTPPQRISANILRVVKSAPMVKIRRSVKLFLEDTVGGVKRKTTRGLCFQRCACPPSATSIWSSLAFRVGSGKNHYESTKLWRTLPEEIRLTKYQKSPNDC